MKQYQNRIEKGNFEYRETRKQEYDEMKKQQALFSELKEKYRAKYGSIQFTKKMNIIKYAQEH